MLKQVSIVSQDKRQIMYSHGHRFAFDHSGLYPRAGTPGVEHESLSLSPIPHVYSTERAVQLAAPQYPSQLHPPPPPPPPTDPIQVNNIN